MNRRASARITILTEVSRGDTVRRWKATARTATIEPLMMNREGEGEGSGAPSSGRLSACTCRWMSVSRRKSGSRP